MISLGPKFNYIHNKQNNVEISSKGKTTFYLLILACSGNYNNFQKERKKVIRKFLTLTAP